MSDNAEQGIARAQAAAVKANGTRGDGLLKHQERSIAYLDERILIFVLAIAFIGLIFLWATSTSPLVLYGSLAGVILLTVVWGIARVKRIKRTRQERERQANQWKSNTPN